MSENDSTRLRLISPDDVPPEKDELFCRAIIDGFGDLWRKYYPRIYLKELTGTVAIIPQVEEYHSLDQVVVI